jgi:hypothetical protein
LFFSAFIVFTPADVLLKKVYLFFYNPEIMFFKLQLLVLLEHQPQVFLQQELQPLLLLLPQLQEPPLQLLPLHLLQLLCFAMHLLLFV